MKTYNPYKMFVGSFIPNWLMSRSEISPGAKLCFARLAQYAGEDGKCFPSQATLAADLGISERNTRRYLSELEKHGLIKINRLGFNRSNTYDFLWHDWINSGPDNKTGPDKTGPDKSVLSGPDNNSGPDESVRMDRTNPSALDRTNPSAKENQLRESKKREGPRVLKDEKKPDPKSAIENLLINMEATENEMAL